MPKTALDVVRRYYAANTASDADVPPEVMKAREAEEVALLHPNIDWTLGEGFALSGRYIGVKAVMEAIVPALGEAFETFSNLPEEFIDAGDQVVVTGRYKGVTRLTRAHLDAEWVHIWMAREGRIVRLRQFTNTAEFNRALGVEASSRMRERVENLQVPAESRPTAAA